MTAEVVRDFLARRFAQIYVDKFMKEGQPKAEAWAKENIKKQERHTFQGYVIREMQNRGYTKIVPGDVE